MDLRSEKGFTLTELVIVLSVMGFLISAVYMFVQAIDVGQDVTNRQVQFSNDIATPLHRIDKFLSQNTKVENNGVQISNGYTLTAKGPMDPDSYVYERRTFNVSTDKKLTESVWKINGRTGAVISQRVNVLSTSNANRERGQMFRYMDASGETTTSPIGAASVEVEVWSENQSLQLNNMKYFHSKRLIYFRNR